MFEMFKSKMLHEVRGCIKNSYVYDVRTLCLKRVAEVDMMRWMSAKDGGVF